MQQGKTACRNDAEEEAHNDADHLERSWRQLWLIIYSQLRKHGINRPRVKSVPEVDCRRVDYSTGESLCENEKFPPVLDCRDPLCPHASLMRTRVLKRLCRRYAPGVSPGDVRQLSPQETVGETGSDDTAGTDHAEAGPLGPALARKAR